MSIFCFINGFNVVKFDNNKLIVVNNINDGDIYNKVKNLLKLKTLKNWLSLKSWILQKPKLIKLLKQDFYLSSKNSIYPIKKNFD